VVCDEDPSIRDLVVATVARSGHEVVGMASSVSAALGLLTMARPDVAIVDMFLGYDSDFDLIQTILDVGATPIVFSYEGDTSTLLSYPVLPAFVPKPDLIALGHALERLDPDRVVYEAAPSDRRVRPTRPAAGPVPTGLSDARAFFEALNDAEEGDGLIALNVWQGAEGVASQAAQMLRNGDRLLLLPSSVRVLLPGGGQPGVQSVLRRIVDHTVAAPDRTAASVVVAPGERGADAFNRLKHSEGFRWV
jgi:hypothetical protein